MRVASLVMLAAMIDVALIGAVLPLIWAAAVMVTGVQAVAADRGPSRSAAGLRIHRGLSAITMGALVIGHSDGAGHAHASLSPGAVVVALGLVVVIGGALLTVSRLSRRTGARGRVAAFEPALMAIAVGAMLAG